MHNGAIKLYYAYGVYCLEQAALCGGGAVLRKVLARGGARGGGRLRGSSGAKARQEASSEDEDEDAFSGTDEDAGVSDSDSADAVKEDDDEDEDDDDGADEELELEGEERNLPWQWEKVRDASSGGMNTVKCEDAITAFDPSLIS